MSESHQALIEKLIPTVKEHAGGVDANAEFPKASVDAFLASGLAGLTSAKEVGGLGQGPRAACDVVRSLAAECGSTAMVVTMHYAGTAVIEQLGDEATRKAVAAGKHLTTLAFSESGSRSHFWAPVSTADKTDGGVKLNAKKSWVTSAHHAASYVWSSQPLAGDAPSSLWLVPRETQGVDVSGGFDGLGLRGNDSCPVTAKDAVIPEKNLLGNDGEGFKYMLEVVLPNFNVLTGSVAVGLMQGAVAATAAHAGGTRFQHLDSPLCELPTIRNYIARMQVRTDQAHALLNDTLTAMETGRADAVLRVLESKASAGEAATEVLDLAMRVCGGAAFRRDVGVERRFRDARAGTVMAPTTDQLYDFIGKAVCGMDVF
jgi:alkylation response protein AidB-like acyl-CoA dehydrogenase